MSSLEASHEPRRLLSWLPPSTATYIYTVFLKKRPIRDLTHAIIKKIIPEKIKIHGVELYLNQRDAIVSGSLALGCYETALLSQFEKLIKPGMCVLDIGANIGLYTVISANKVGENGFVAAVEPEKLNCEFVERSLSLNGLRNAKVFQNAAGNLNKTISLFLCEENMADHRIFDPSGSRQSTNVEMIRIDDLVATHVKRKVDLIKMDVQGAEAMAFDGMQTVLNSNKDIKVFMEFWPWGLNRAGASPLDLLNNINQQGFKIYEFIDTANDFKEVSNYSELANRTQERQHANLLLQRS